MNSPKALADAISTLFHNNKLRNQIAEGALKTYQQSASTDLLKSVIQNSIKKALNSQE
jgi:hypothetical protein